MPQEFDVRKKERDGSESADQLQKENRPSVFLEAVQELPTAVGDLGRGIVSQPIQFGEHVAVTVGVSVAASFALSYVMPARGPYGLILGAGMMLPTLYHMGKGLWNAHTLSQKPGADTHAIGHQLADQTIVGSLDLGLNFLGGWAGAKAAYKLADCNTLVGEWSRNTRSWILDKENATYLKIKELPDAMTGMFKSAPEATGAEAFQILTNRSLRAQPRAVVDQSLAATPKPIQSEGAGLPEAPNGLTQKYGNFHSHSSFTDGDGTPEELYSNAKKAGYDFWEISEHNHDGARMGVEPNSERAAAEANVPLLAQDPKQWQAIKAEADKATVNGKFQAGVAEEMGVIGKLPPKVGADGEPLPGGVNHTILRNFDQTFVRTQRPPKLLDRLSAPFMRLLGQETAPPANPVADIADGRFDLLARYLTTHEDPNNPAQAIGAHPRWLQDTSDKTPDNLRFHDYGIKEMGGVDQWAEGYGSKHFLGLEVVKGEALNPGPVSTLKPNDIDLTSYNGYLDLFGNKVKAAPYAGLDTHFKDRIGDPDLATGLLVSKLDQAGITEAVAARRSIATTSMSKVNGYMAADDGKFLMGQTIDQGLIPRGVTPQVRINGEVTPAANYDVNLWLDSKLGDGESAKVVQTKSVSGADLLSHAQTVSFDPVKPNPGDGAAFYIEVRRTDPDSPKYGDVLGILNKGDIGAAGARSSEGIAAIPHSELMKSLISGPVEGPHGGTVWQPESSSEHMLPDPLLSGEFSKDSNMLYPERMITAPIWIQPANVAQHSLLVKGLAGTVVTPSQNQAGSVGK